MRQPSADGRPANITGSGRERLRAIGFTI